VTTIHLIGSTDDFRTLVERALKAGAPAEIAMIETGGFDPEIVRAVSQACPDLVAIGPDLSISDSLKLIEEIGKTAPQVPTILIGYPTADLWPQAVRAGARDIVTPVAKAVVLRESFERALEAGRKLRVHVPDYATPPAPGAVAVAEAGRVIAIVSPKGGSGKTTVAANLAATVARERPGDVVLADLDVQFGDVGHAYRLDPEYSLLNAVAPGVSPTVLKGFLTPHPSKVLALTAPERPEDADDIDAAASTASVRQLAGLFPVIIVDTGAGLDDHTLSVLEVASDVILVTATDVPSVRAVVKEYDILERLGLLKDRRKHLVLNRADARVGLSVSDIEQTIGLKASLTIPSTKAIPTALNLGEPLVIGDERGPVARSFTEFAQELGVIDQPASMSRPWRKR
jgi:pilus assembly protein CpaE